MTTPHAAGAHITHGDDGTPIKDAATIMLLRDHGGALEVFAIRRAATMVFAGGAVAFPGGGVDIGDFAPIADTGPTATQWAARLGVCAQRAGALRTAAVRECFEETGVLLAVPAPHRVPAQSSGDVPLGPQQRARWRRRLDTHEQPLTAFLTAAGVHADSSRLKEVSRWITPPGNPRRYDTFFFAVAVADHDIPDGSSAEFDACGWARPQTLVDAWKRQDVALLPPTAVTLQQLATAESVADFMARPSNMAPIRNDLRGTV